MKTIFNKALLFFVTFFCLTMVSLPGGATEEKHGNKCEQHQSTNKKYNDNSDDCNVSLEITTVSSSVWEDGSVSLAIPILNIGNKAVDNVQVSSVSFGNGNRVNPTNLPVLLGEIISTQSAVLDARFQSIAIPGKYSLTVSGTYSNRQGKSHRFNLQSQVAVAKSTNGTSSTTAVIVPKHTTSGVPVLPSPIEQENENNPVGPPIPDGPTIKPFTVAPTNTGVAAASSSGSGVTFVRDTGTGQTGFFPPDPTVAAGASGDNLVFASANTYVLFSQDDGVTFQRLDPTTIGWPQSDGGLCCDQVITYVPSVNLVFWLLQYKSSAPVPANPNLPGPNRLRIAWASPQSMKTNINSWTYVDLQSSTFNLGNLALDFPDLAFTNTFLYTSVDIQTTPKNVRGLIVARISLADITGSGSTVGVSYLSPTESIDQNTATGARLTQSSADAMYWGGHVDSSRIKVFRWADNSNSVDRHNTQVNTWCKNPKDYSTLAPDNRQWLDSSRTSASSIIGATRKPGQTAPDGEVWLAWGSGKDSGGASPCTQGRSQPYVKIARINDRTLDSVGEYHIWNTAYAFAYPALATDPSGQIGVSVAFGGSSNYASTTVGYLGDFVVYFVEPSDVTLTFTQTDAAGNLITNSDGSPTLYTRFGDYFTVRNSGPSNTYFSSQGYAVRLVDPARSTNCTTAPGCTFHPHYEQWGRPPQVIK